MTVKLDILKLAVKSSTEKLRKQESVVDIAQGTLQSLFQHCKDRDECATGNYDARVHEKGHAETATVNKTAMRATRMTRRITVDYNSVT